MGSPVSAVETQLKIGLWIFNLYPIQASILLKIGRIFVFDNLP